MAILKRTAMAILCLVLTAYPLDWAVWRVRLAFGDGMGSAPVTETTAATLKGNHFEVYAQQTTSVSCSRSVLPQAGGGPCWWLHRHPHIVTQY